MQRCPVRRGKWPSRARIPRHILRSGTQRRPARRIAGVSTRFQPGNGPATARQRPGNGPATARQPHGNGTAMAPLRPGTRTAATRQSSGSDTVSRPPPPEPRGGACAVAPARGSCYVPDMAFACRLVPKETRLGPAFPAPGRRRRGPIGRTDRLPPVDRANFFSHRETSKLPPAALGRPARQEPRILYASRAAATGPRPRPTETAARRSGRRLDQSFFTGFGHIRLV
jgi:hypothetical protein